MALLALFPLKIAVSAAFVVIKDFLLSFLNITPNSCMFNTFSTLFTANTSGSSLSVALIKEKKQIWIWILSSWTVIRILTVITMTHKGPWPQVLLCVLPCVLFLRINWANSVKFMETNQYPVKLPLLHLFWSSFNEAKVTDSWAQFLNLSFFSFSKLHFHSHVWLFKIITLQS